MPDHVPRAGVIGHRACYRVRNPTASERPALGLGLVAGPELDLLAVAERRPALGVEALAGLRVAQGLSQEALADELGFGRSYLSGIERGVRNPSALQLVRLAKKLAVSVGDLFPI